MIVAVSQNGVIGRAGGLPWHLPEDLKRFKRLTMGHHIIMGRATYESLGRCLPGRTSVVVTRSDELTPPGPVLVRSLAAALRVAADDPEPFLIGGGQLYETARPIVDRIYLTRVLADFDGDTFLDLAQWRLQDPSAWTLQETSPAQVSPNGQIPFQFQTWQRILAASSSPRWT